MKADCPVCKQTFVGDTELAVNLKLLEHMKTLPGDRAHLNALAPALEYIDRHVTFASTVARDDTNIRIALYDKCASMDSRLQTLYLYATSHLTIAAQACRTVLIECGADAPITDKKAAQRLRRTLLESLLVAERNFRR